MASPNELVESYLQAVQPDVEGSAETRFLRSIPWRIDGDFQRTDWLIRGLRHEAQRFVELPNQALFSLITPLWNTPPRLLDELILSVRCQSWQNWELVLVDDGSRRRDHLDVAARWADLDPRIKLSRNEQNLGISGARNVAIERSRGNFVGILDHDDLLHPSALGVFARQITAEPGLNLIFSNEAKISEDSARTSWFYYKPPFDVPTLLRSNYVCHFTAIRRDLLDSAARDGRIFRPEYDGVEDHDLFLRLALTGRLRAHQIPLFLYYWRTVEGSTATAPEAKRGLDRKRVRLLDELVPAFYPGMRSEVVLPGPTSDRWFPSLRLAPASPIGKPSLLVLIPFKDDAPVTCACLESIERQRHDLDVHVLLIDNRSEDPATIPTLRAWIGRPRSNRYQIIAHDGPFNYAKIHNTAIRDHGSDKDLLLFLNNDVCLKTPDCLQVMATQLGVDRACGFIGIKLVYPDGITVQHGGVKLGEHPTGSGYFPIWHSLNTAEFVHEERVAFAVTFACAMTRAETFRQLGGLEEVTWPNGTGDIATCARAIEAGYRNYYFGTLTAIHHESKSRGVSCEEFELVKLYERHGQTLTNWRLRSQALWPDPTWPGSTPTATFYPLRYQIVDRLNHALKAVLGPLHHVLRRGIALTWLLLKEARRKRRHSGRNRVDRTPAHRSKRPPGSAGRQPVGTRNAGKDGDRSA